MSALLRNVKIRYLVLIAVLGPSLGLLGMSIFVFFDKQSTVSEMKRLTEIVAVATEVSNLVHELQKERGESSVFVGSGGKRMVQELPEQQKKTDLRRAEFNRALAVLNANRVNGALGSVLQDALDHLERLSAVRQSVHDLKISAGDTAIYFSETIRRLLNAVMEMASAIENAEVSRVLLTYVTFMEMKERAGQERAVGASGLALGAFDPVLHRRFIGILAEQVSYANMFRSLATPAQLQYYNEIVRGDSIEKVEKTRKILVESATGASFAAHDPVEWFNVNTQRINLMKQVEDRVAGDLLAAASHVRSRAETTFYTALAVGLGLLGIAGIIGPQIVRGITQSIALLTQAMTRLASGDTSVDVSHVRGENEVGAMAAAVGVFRENLIRSDQLAAEQRREEAAKEQRRHVLENAINGFDNSVHALIAAIVDAGTGLNQTAAALSDTAQHANGQAVVVANAADQASGNVQTVAAAAEELSSSISEIGRRMSESSQVASAAVEQAQRSNATVAGLVEAAQRIGEVVQLINNIASQTNLLALNATIEAARAGEAGKGFAVVASEVKNLANQTGKATDDISTQISEIQAVAGGAAEAIKGVGVTIAQIDHAIATVAAAVEKQDAATREIAGSVQQASVGMHAVSSSIATVTSAAGEVGSLANKVLSAASDLSRHADILRREVDTFIDRVRVE